MFKMEADAARNAMDVFVRDFRKKYENCGHNIDGFIFGKLRVCDTESQEYLLWNGYYSEFCDLQNHRMHSVTKLANANSRRVASLI